jgi:Mg2+-importing ATPase
MTEAVLRKGERARRIDPLDSAVLRHEHPDISGYRKHDEIPFDFERRRVSVVLRREAGGESELLLVTKGAPEHVLSICTRYERDGDVQPLDADARARAQATFTALCAAGHRVIAVASRVETEGRAYDKEDEHDLVLAGFLGFADPVREDAEAVLAALRTAGIEVKVLTGDSELVARHVCERVGLRAAHVMLGADVDKLSDPALAHRAERTAVFARLSPVQKDRVIHALRSRGHVVGFLGDGINDAPSLRAADVGSSGR